MSNELRTSKNTNQQAKMVQGVAWLTVGDFFSRFLGAVYIIPWYQWIGEYRTQANALFSMGYTIYGIFLAVSTVGINVAVAKQIAKYNALGQSEKGFYVVNRFLRLMLLIGLVFATGMYVLAPVFASLAGAEESLIPVMRSLSVAVLFFPMMSVLRGVFQGYSKLSTFAVSQVVEQVLRVAWMLAATYYIMKLGSGNYIEAVTQSTFAAFIGMIGSLLVLLISLMREGLLGKILHVKPQDIQTHTTSLLLETAKEAIPFVIVGLTIQLHQLIDLNSFVNLMRFFTGQSKEALLTLYSFMTSNPSKITMLLIAITGSLGNVSIPLITENIVKGDRVATAKLILQNLHMSMFLLIPAVMGAILLSRPLYAIFYGQGSSLEIALFIVNLLQVFLLGMNSLLGSIIVALLEKRKAIYYFCYGILVKLLLQVPFVWLFGVYGPLLSTTIGLTLSNYLMYKRIHNVTQFNRRIVYKDFVIIAFITAIMIIGVSLVTLVTSRLFVDLGRLGSLLQLVIPALTGVIIYGGLSLWTRQGDKLIGKTKSSTLRQKLRIP